MLALQSIITQEHERRLREGISMEQEKGKGKREEINGQAWTSIPETSRSVLTNEQAQANHKTGVNHCSLSAPSAWHLQGLETFWDLKPPHLLTLLYHWIYPLTCRSVRRPFAPWLLFRCSDIQLWSRQEQLAQSGAGKTGVAPRKKTMKLTYG